MTIDPSLGDLLKSKYKENQEEFWPGLFDFLETALTGYYKKCTDLGFTTFLNEEKQKSSLVNLMHLRDVYFDLEKINRLASFKQSSSQADEKIKLKDSELQQHKDYINDLSKELNLKETQIQNKLYDELEVLRDRIIMINEYSGNALTKPKEVAEEIGVAIQTIVAKLESANLWREEDPKPEIKRYEDVEKEAKAIKSKTRQSKKDTKPEIVAEINEEKPAGSEALTLFTDTPESNKDDQDGNEKKKNEEADPQIS